MTLPNEHGCLSMPETQAQRNQCQTMARTTNLSENIGAAEVRYHKPAAALTFCKFVYLVNTDLPSIFFNLPTPLSSVYISKHPIKLHLYCYYKTDLKPNRYIYFSSHIPTVHAIFFKSPFKDAPDFRIESLWWATLLPTQPSSSNPLVPVMRL